MSKKIFWPVLFTFVQAQANVCVTEIGTYKGISFIEFYNSTNEDVNLEDYVLEHGKNEDKLDGLVKSDSILVIKIDNKALMCSHLLLKKNGLVMDSIPTSELSECNENETLQRDTICINSDFQNIYPMSKFYRKIITQGKIRNLIVENHSIVNVMNNKKDMRSFHPQNTISIGSDSLQNPEYNNTDNLLEKSIASATPILVTDFLDITAYGDETIHYALHTILGKQIFQGQFNNSVSINMEELSEGVYLLQLHNSKYYQTIKLQKK